MAARDRTRYDQRDADFFVYQNGVVVNSYRHPVLHTAEHLSDSTGDKTTFNPCLHNKVLAQWYGPFPPFTVGEGNYITYAGVPASLEFDIYAQPPPMPPGRAAQISRRALDNATTQMPTSVSIANFLLDLKNPKENFLPRLRKWASTHTAADILLWWKFGLEPTIRDAKNIMKSWKQTRDRLDHLRKINNRTVTLHTRHKVKYEPVEPPPSIGWGYDPIYPWPTLRQTSLEMMCYVSIQATYALQGLDGPFAFWDSLAATLGLNNPVGIYWEKIPFSFVVDWFVNVGDFIENYNPGKATFDGDIRVVACHHSLKWTRVSEILGPISWEDGFTPYGTLVERGYCRRDGLPEGALDTNGLTPMQLLLGAALLDSHGVFSKKRRRGRYADCD